MIRVSAVSYLNTRPFIAGLEEKRPEGMTLSLDFPAACAEKLLNGKADIGLVPTAVLPLLKDTRIVTPYCIGAEGPVNTVMLYGEVPITEMKEILLDYQSRTSVELLQILAREYWKVQPAWSGSVPGFESRIVGNTGGLVIGDRTFVLNKRFPYCYDLSEAWKDHTGLPFVFACWVANSNVSEEFVAQFAKSLELGVRNIEEALKNVKIEGARMEEMLYYLQHNISYTLDLQKRKGLDLFLEKLVQREKEREEASAS